MRTLTLFLASALLLSIAANAQAMDADELIGKILEASGGVEALKEVQSQKTTGVFSTQGMDIPLTVMHKRPNRLRVEVEFQGMGIIQCYDGSAGWQINPMMGSSDPQDLSPMEVKGLAFQADMDGLFIGYKEKGYTVEYVGEDEVEGTPVHHLHIDTNQDTTFDVYVDAEYFLVIKQSMTMKIEETEFSQDTYLSDFKEVGPLILPHAVEARMGGVVANTFSIESIELGAEIAEDAFDRPPPAPKKEPATEG